MVEHSFKKCGISNNLDSANDDVLFNNVCDFDNWDTDSDVACLWDNTAVPMPVAFLDSDNESDVEGF